MVATWTHLTTKNANNTNATGSVSPTASSLVILSFCSNGSDTDPTIGGTLTGTWVKLHRWAAQSQCFGVYYNANPGASGTVQITGGGATWTGIMLDQVIDVGVAFSVPPVRQSTLENAANASSPFTTTLTSTPNSAVFVAVLMADQSVSPGTGWTSLQAYDATWANLYSAKGTAVPGPQIWNGTHSLTSYHGVVILEAGFPAASGGYGPFRHRRRRNKRRHNRRFGR